MAVLPPERDHRDQPGVAGVVCVEDRAAGVAEALSAAARATAVRVAHQQVVAAGEVAPQVHQLVRTDEPLAHGDLEVRPFELNAVAQDGEVDALLAARRRKPVEVARWCNPRKAAVLSGVEDDDPNVVRVRNGDRPIPAGMGVRRAADVALAGVAAVTRAGDAAARIVAAWDRARTEPNLRVIRRDAEIGVDPGAVAGREVDRRRDHRPGAAPQRNAVVIEHGQAHIRMTVAVGGAAQNRARRG